MLPSWMLAPVAVTVRPRSTRRPVPCCRFPNRAVVYQLVCQGVAGSPDSAFDAFCELSPSEVPAGPTAAALTGVTWATGNPFVVGGVGVLDPRVLLGLGR